MIIRVQTSSEKGTCCKAIKVAAGVEGEILLANRLRFLLCFLASGKSMVTCCRAGVESVTLAGEDRNLLLVIGVGVDSNRITKKLRQKVGHAEVVELRTVDDELVAPHEHAYRYHPSPSPYNKHQHTYYAGAGGSSYPRDHHYHPSPYSKHAGGGSAYALPPTMAAGGRDRDYYYGGGGGGGYYPGQYQYQHQQQFYQAPAGNTHTVVHHEYGYGNDPNSCSIM